MSDNKIHENVAGDSTPVPENPKFPEGLRVIAVDDDPVSLRAVAVMLEKCKYKVTSKTNATEALELLRKNRESYDIVLTDVRMPDMDGFELLKVIGLEMDIPVIMMSVNDSTENVMKGVRHGARDYLVKPVRILELKNIWQHVMRKTVLNPEKSALMTQEIVTGDFPVKKRQVKDKEKEDANPLSDGASSKKKRRFAWTEGLHKKFVDAVQKLDANKAVPKQIVELMDEPEITREIVASHLQKYRNFLKKQQDNMREGHGYNAGYNAAGYNASGYNAGPRGMHEDFLHHTPNLYSDYKVPPLVRDTNNGSSSGIGIMPFREHPSRPDTLTNSRWNETFPIGSVNNQNWWSQQPQMANQVQAPLAQSWVAPSGRLVVEDYADLTPQLPNFDAVQAGPPLGFANYAGQSSHSGFPPCKQPPTEHASHPCAPGAFGQSFQSNALPGQHDGRVASTAFNGGVGSDCRAYPVDFQTTDNSRANGQGAYMQLLTGNMDNNHHNSLGSFKEEFSTEENQIGPSTSAPQK